MASTFVGENAKAGRPSVSPCDLCDTVTVTSTYAIAAALVINDIIQLARLPAGSVVTDLKLFSADMDTNVSPTIVLECGLYELDGTVVDADAYVAASTVAQAGGIQAMNNRDGFTIAPAEVDRLVCVKVPTAPATGATSGTLGIVVSYHASRYGA